MIQKKLILTLAVSLGVAYALTQPGLAQAPAAQQAPTFQVDTTWPVIPNNWVLGTVTSVAVSADDRVWLIHRPRSVAADKRANAAPAVLEFDRTGKFVKAWGGDGQGYDWPSAEHGIFLDHKGNLWVTGSNPSGGLADRPVDNMVLKFTNQGKFIMQIGGRGQPGGNKDTKNLERAADVAVYAKTNEVFVADGYGNRRVIVYDADTGAYKRMWGAFGRPPDSDPPAPTAGAYGATTRPEQKSEKEQPDGNPEFANPVHSVRISNDGLIYVADRTNRRIQVFTADGKYVDQVFINRTQGPSACGMAFSPDREQKYMYVADYGNSKLLVIDRKTLKILYQFGSRGPEPGNFQGLHQLAADSKGNLYAVEVAPGNRAQRFLFKGVSTPPSQ